MNLKEPMHMIRDDVSTLLFQRDSSEYDILAEGVASAPKDGLFLEIGLRRGGGMKVILDGIIERGIAATAIAIDCYGHMPYMVREGHRDDFDYTNEMRNETLAGIYDWLRGRPVNFQFFNMTDTQFFTHFSNGVPGYNGKREIIMDRYSLVHVDGQHTLESVLAAFRFFHSRMTRDGLICYDDIAGYDHARIDRIMLSNGWQTVRRGGNKALYRYHGENAAEHSGVPPTAS